MYDAVSLAVKGALFNTRLPKVEAAIMDGGNIELSLSEDPYECVRLHVDSVPILVTICKIGEHCIVDPSSEEEVCSLASLVVGVSVRNGTGTFIAHKWIRSYRAIAPLDGNVLQLYRLRPHRIHHEYSNKRRRLIPHGNTEQVP